MLGAIILQYSSGTFLYKCFKAFTREEEDVYMYEYTIPKNTLRRDNSFTWANIFHPGGDIERLLFSLREKC